MQTLTLLFASADPAAHVRDETWLPMVPETAALQFVTKYQILLAVAALVVLALFVPLARRIATGEPVRGPLWNFLESLLLFIRDDVVRPNIQSGHADGHGHHDHPTHDPHALADRYLPLIWTLFLFILTCNLLGMIPFLGSPTASISVTAALALIVFVTIQVSALLRFGALGFVKSFIPQLKTDNPILTVGLMLTVVPLVAVIEFAGIFIRGGVLAIRLFANMYGGHVALAAIFALSVAANGSLSVGGGIGAVALGTALSLLELLVAFLQAFVFVLLTSIFLGLQLNPEH